MSKTRTCTIHNNQLWAPIQCTYITYQHISHHRVHKVRNRNSILNHSKTLQFLPNFTNHPLFISLIGCQSRKPQTKTERKVRHGNSPPRGWSRAPSRAGDLVRLLARFLAKNEGFHPKTPNPTISIQNQVYTTSPHFHLHLVTYNHYPNSRLMINWSSLPPKPTNPNIINN